MNADAYFDDKIVIVTGAASGIGRALCAELARHAPRHLLLADINGDGLLTTRGLLPHVDTTSHVVDVSSEHEVRDLFVEAVRRHGRIDVVFNNAGIAAGGEFQEYEFEDWDRLLKINLWSIIYGCTFAYRQMLRQRDGHIVNTSSLGGLVPEPMAVAYATTKHAVVGLSTTLRAEARAHGIKVSVACPGVIRTPIFDAATYAGPVDPAKVKAATLEHGALPADVCARRIVSGVARNKPIILVRRLDHLLWLLYRTSPSALNPLNSYLASYFRTHFCMEDRVRYEEHHGVRTRPETASSA